jgi:hypothetical protein
MQPLETTGIVRRTIEEPEGLAVSFYNHDGYFRVPPSDHSAALTQKILEVEQTKQEIAFTFDQALHILKIM